MHSLIIVSVFKQFPVVLFVKYFIHPIASEKRSYARPHLHDGDVICDTPDNVTSKKHSIQFTATLAVTRAIKNFSYEGLWQELELESQFLQNC